VRFFLSFYAKELITLSRQTLAAGGAGAGGAGAGAGAGGGLGAGQQQGPVAQPLPTVGTPHGPTPYTYTTTDALGDPTAVVAVFTPTFTSAITSPTLQEGTVWDYSSWLQVVGTNTVAPKQTNGVRRSFGMSEGEWKVRVGSLAGVVGGVVGGAWMVIF
jgi:hypothetical protein